MTQFTFKTMVTDSTTYDGPSGERYVIYKEAPFKVDKPEDIEAFKKNPRFQEVGIFTKPKVKDDIDESMSKELSLIRGIDKKAVKAIVESYLSMDNLVSELEQGFDIKPKLSKRQKSILKKYIMKKYI